MLPILRSIKPLATIRFHRCYFTSVSYNVNTLLAFGHQALAGSSTFVSDTIWVQRPPYIVSTRLLLVRHWPKLCTGTKSEFVIDTIQLPPHSEIISEVRDILCHCRRFGLVYLNVIPSNTSDGYPSLDFYDSVGVMGGLRSGVAFYT